MKKIIPIVILSLLVSISCSKQTRYAVTTEDPIEISGCRATLKASGKNGDSKKITEKGFCYSADKIPEYIDNTSPSTNGFVDLFEAEVKGLKPNTQYNVKAYTKFSDGTTLLGNLITFQTNGIYMPGDQGPAGGIIFYTDQSSSSAKYFEVIVNASPSYAWGCYGTELSSISLITGSGLANSNSILSNCGSNTAAAYCINLVSNGFSDWYLPSIAELGSLYSFSKSNPDRINARQYWSSSQWDANQAYGIDFAASSSWVKINKTSSYPVIAIRSFN